MEENNIKDKEKEKSVTIELSKKDLVLLHASLMLGLKGFANDEANAKKEGTDIGACKLGFAETLEFYVCVRNLIRSFNIDCFEKQ